MKPSMRPRDAAMNRGTRMRVFLRGRVYFSRGGSRAAPARSALPYISDRIPVFLGPIDGDDARGHEPRVRHEVRRNLLEDLVGVAPCRAGGGGREPVRRELAEREAHSALRQVLERRLADIGRRGLAGLGILPGPRGVAERLAVLVPHRVVVAEARRVVAEADEHREVGRLEVVAVLVAGKEVSGELRAVDDAARRDAVEEEAPLAAGNLVP